MAGNTRKEKNENTDPPVWEWILAGLGVVMVAASIGAMIYRAATQENTPPAFEVSVNSVTAAGGGYLVTFSVLNTGSQTAAALNIEGNLIMGEEKLETSAMTLTYVPARSERQGGLFFVNDPRNVELKIYARGYEKP